MGNIQKEAGRYLEQNIASRYLFNREIDFFKSTRSIFNTACAIKPREERRLFQGILINYQPIAFYIIEKVLSTTMIFLLRENSPKCFFGKDLWKNVSLV